MQEEVFPIEPQNSSRKCGQQTKWKLGGTGTAVEIPCLTHTIQAWKYKTRKFQTEITSQAGGWKHKNEK